MIILNNYIISEAFDSLHRQKLTESTSRQELMDLVDSAYRKCDEFGLLKDAERILTLNNASEDDSDPAEGFYKTMSNKDLENAYKQLTSLLPQINAKELVKEIIDCLWNHTTSEAILGIASTDTSFSVETTSGTYKFNLEPVELDDNSISYTDDDFGDWS